MYSIGEFSKINRITVKALRHYDEIGLFKPCRVDGMSGYRYYSSGQMPTLHRIMSFKQMGLALAEIGTVLESEGRIGALLMQKATEAQRRIAQEGTKLSHIRNYLKSFNGGLENMSDIIVKSLPEVSIASMRRVIKNYNELFHLAPNVMGEAMRKAGCVCAKPDYCFNIYHDGEYKEADIDVELCEAVTELKEDDDVLSFKRLGEVPSAACLLHKGSYETLGKSYAAINSWIAENGYKVVGLPRESYIDGCWNKETEEDWLTELQFPIEEGI